MSASARRCAGLASAGRETRRPASPSLPTPRDLCTRRGSLQPHGAFARSAGVLLCLLLWMALAVVEAKADVGPIGGEFRVNSSLPSSVRPSVAMAADGAFVITWVGWDGSNNVIRAQRYDSAGIAQGSELRVNTSTIEPSDPHGFFEFPDLWAPQVAPAALASC